MRRSALPHAIGSSLSAARWDPPAMSWIGSVWSTCHTNHAPIGPRKLHEIADRETLREIGRNLAIRKSLDRELDTPVRARRRGDRIFPHGRIAVTSRYAEVDAPP